MSRISSELARATENAQSSEGQALHDDASRLMTTLSEGGQPESLEVAGLIHATVLAGQNLEAKCR